MLSTHRSGPAPSPQEQPIDRRIDRGTLTLLGLLTGWFLAASPDAATPYLELCTRLAAPIPDGSKLLISQPCWLGLEKAAGLEMRSIHLLRLRRLRNLGGSAAGIDEVMAELAPDYVVVEDYFLDPDSTDPRAPLGGGDASRVFGELRDYLARHCPPIHSVADPDYGRIGVYRCR